MVERFKNIVKFQVGIVFTKYFLKNDVRDLKQYFTTWKFFSFPLGMWTRYKAVIENSLNYQ